MPEFPVRFTVPAVNDVTEVVRALNVCLRGTRPWPRTRPDCCPFDTWTRESFPACTAPHLLRVYDAAIAGGPRSIVAADREYSRRNPAGGSPDGPSSSRAGSACGLPVLTRFLAAVARGDTPGHFHTVLALRAASFQIGVIPMLQAAVYAEWAAGRLADPPSPGSVRDFLNDASAHFSLIPSILSRHELPRPAAAGR